MSEEELQERLIALKPKLNIDQQRAALESLRSRSEATDLWDDPESAAATMSELRSTEALLNQWDELEGLLGIGLEVTDLQALVGEIEQLEQRALLSAEHDQNNAIVTVHAGTGGVDAQDWAEMLMRMFLRYVEAGMTEEMQNRTLSMDRTQWKATVVDLVRGEEAGIKRVEMEIRGPFAFGLLKSEAGVHRLVRISPFGAKGLRQTSFALVEVIPEVEKSATKAIDEKDLRIDVYRSGGHGGQGVNTTDSAVRITHIPSGLVVAVQNERSQHQNKATAMTILASRLARLKELQNAEDTAILKGEFKEGSWGNQIRSYVLQPYQLVKDHRTNQETANIQKVLDGDLAQFIQQYLVTT